MRRNTMFSITNDPNKVLEELGRLTKDDLIAHSVPTKKYKLQVINNFLNTVFDDYINEYGAHFTKKLEVFEESLALVKREIDLE